MTVFYNLGIFIYALFIKLASGFNSKAKLFIRGRKNWEVALKQKIDPNKKYIWFHCASLGEFEQCRPVIEEVKSKFPEKGILLTFFSPSGYEIRKNYEGADVISYLPMDTRKNALRFLQIAQPEKVLFVKYEFWYNYISEIKKQGIKLYAISAIFRENQLFFKNSPWAKWYRKILDGFTHFFIQNEKSAELLTSIGISNYSITGDTRFDRVAAISANSAKFPMIEKWKENQPLIVIGSSWKPDEDLLVEFINKHKAGTRFIIAPHEVSENNIQRIEQSLQKKSIRFSQTEGRDISEIRAIIIDSIGILSSLYQYGEIAYIGGGFGVGIHNTLEAATYGMPIVFGPNYHKFDEACNLVTLGAAFPINSYDDLGSIFDGLLNNKDRLKEAGKISRKFVEKNLGASSKITKKVFNI